MTVFYRKCKTSALPRMDVYGGGLCVRLQQNDRQFIAFFCVLTHCVKMNYYFFNYEYFFKCAYK